ncbi:MAG: JAB domain-containing protein [Nitrospirae bacterium]|nr:JAB domain-containing protein [Nitrospirota bacterium]
MTLQRIELKIVREKTSSYGNCECIKNPADVYEMFKWLGDDIQENFYVLCMDTGGKAIGFYLAAKGSTNYANVEMANIIRPALLTNAPRIILIHNHPSGDPRPSREDKMLTQRVKEACDLFGITLNDHVIIGYESYISCAEQK